MFCKCQKQLPIQYVIFDPLLVMEDRLLCKDCKIRLEEKRKDKTMNQIRDLEDVLNFLNDTEIYERNYLNFITQIGIKEIEKFILKLENIRTKIMMWINTLFQFSKSWISDLASLNQKQQQKEDFFNKLDDLIKQKNTSELISELKIKQKVEKINNSWIKKIKIVLDDEKLSTFSECYEFLEDISMIINTCKNYQQDNFKSFPYLSICQSSFQSTEAILGSFIEDKQITANTQSRSLYQLIKQNYQYKSSKQFCSFSFNKDNTLIVSGCSKVVKAFILKKGQLKQIQILNGHEDHVRTLNFFKISSKSTFVSASEDRSIRFWSFNLLAKPKYIQKLCAHLNGILCLILNKNEDLMVTGSRDTTIKFWKRSLEKQNYYMLWSQQQIIGNHSHNVYDLSLSQNEDKIISCSEDKRILVLQYQDKQWKISQIITVQHFGYRLCFINNKLFTFQPRLASTMHVYEMNQNNQYGYSFEIEVKGGNQECRIFFPQQYIQHNNILINKNGFHINIIKVATIKEEIERQNVSFTVQQSINYFQDSIGLVFGQLSDDGQFLITWDDKTKELQLRQLQYV